MSRTPLDGFSDLPVVEAALSSFADEGLPSDTGPTLHRAVFGSPPRAFAITTDEQLPAALAATAQSVAELLRLFPNWDSYAARPVDLSRAVAAMQVLLQVMGSDTPVPAVVPTSRGGVQFEWHTRGVDLELEVITPQHLLVSFEDSTTGQSWNREISLDLGPLARGLERLTPL